MRRLESYILSYRENFIAFFTLMKILYRTFDGGLCQQTLSSPALKIFRDFMHDVCCVNNAVKPIKSSLVLQHYPFTHAVTLTQPDTGHQELENRETWVAEGLNHRT